jgi:type 1 glutamine amidotransferase
MKTSPLFSPLFGTSFLAVPLLALMFLALIASACTASGPSAADLNKGGGGAVATSTGGRGSGGSGVSGGSSGGAAGSSIPETGGSPGTDAGGSGGISAAGTGGSGMVGAGTGGAVGSGGTAPPGPYAPRSGSFKMLVYSRTAGFRHDASIITGKAMLQQIATEQGFQVVITETNELITPTGLADFEIIFFMNSTGDIFNATEQQTYETWMTTRNGAFGGVHSATDTENGWAFYSEVTGQYYNGHGAANTPDQIQFEPSVLNFPALTGLPNPWQRNEEWYRFDTYQQWSVKPGFQILGRKTADNQPIMWTREWGNFRSFYTAIGHDASVFQDPNVKKHVTGGIMWAVRREHLIK